MPKGEDWQHPGSDGKVHRVVLPAYGRRHGVKEYLGKAGKDLGPVWSAREGQGCPYKRTP